LSNSNDGESYLLVRYRNRRSEYGHTLIEPGMVYAVNREDDLNLTWQDSCRMVMRKGRQ
jgi:hypothetical protein